MGSIFEQHEPDILAQYYSKSESFWQKARRSVQNVFRRLRGDEPLGYDESTDEYDDDAYEEWAWFSDKD